MSSVQRSRSWGRGLTAALLLVAAAVGLAVDVVVTAAGPSPLTAELLDDVLEIGFVVVGTVVVAARPTNRVGWVMLVGGAGGALGAGSLALARHGLVIAPGSIAGASGLAVGGQVLRSLGWLVMTTGLAVIFPDGRVAGPRWRWLYRAFAVVVLASILDPVLDPGGGLTGMGSWRNPIAPHGAWQLLEIPVFLTHLGLTAVVTVAAVVQLVQRWRRGDELLRQQLRLYAGAVLVTVAATPLALVAGGGAWVFGVASVPLPLLIGFAVLARGLYDLRTAANRTLVWLALSVVVAVLFALVIGLGGLLGSSASSPWLACLAAGLTAACFAPLHRALQRGVNRVTYGRWTEPYELLATLGQQLEASADVDRVLENVTVQLEALGLREVRITPYGDPEPLLAADDVTLPLHAYGALTGHIRYRQPDPPLRPADHRLVDDLAGHLGSVLHARLLTDDLRRARERLVLGREEERRRLRRDLHDGLGPALAGHLLRLDLIARTTTPGTETSELVERLRAELRETVLEVRRVVEGLRPPALDELGLTGAVAQATHRLTTGSGATATVHADVLPALPAAIEVAAYRIAIEAVTNAVKHAGASRCMVAIRVVEDQLVVTVEDDGVGIAETGRAEGHGLHTMRERTEELRGAFTLDALARGSRVRAALPLPATRTATASTAGTAAPASEPLRTRTIGPSPGSTTTTAPAASGAAR